MHFQETFFIKFPGKRFSRRVMYQKAIWRIRMHDFSECSFSLTTSLFGMIIIDIASVLKLLPYVLEREKKTSFFSKSDHYIYVEVSFQQFSFQSSLHTCADILPLNLWWKESPK